jgi:DNA-binding XRE family transcriptional regulator
MIATQQYRSVAAVRGAFLGQREKLMAAPNAEATRFRRSLGLSQKAMAERFGVSASTWQKIELGLRSVPAAVLQAMGAK